MRKVVSAMLVAAMATGMVAGCGSSSDSKSDKKDAKGKVYYLNFKPEQDEQWQDLAKEYTKETGVDVTVLTAASGEYEKTLKSEMAKSKCSDTVPGKRTGWTCKLERLLLRSERF